MEFEIKDNVLVKFIYSYDDTEDTVVVPDYVTVIGKNAFDNSFLLNKIILPKGLKEIEDQAFSKCGSLTELEIPEGVTKIGNGVFESCNKLKSITIPSSVKSIGNGAFDFCSSLEEVVISNGVKKIGNCVFNMCDKLSKIFIPESVTELGNGIFKCCSNLENIEVDKNNKVFSSFDGVLYDKTGTKVIYIPGGKKESLTLPEGVTEFCDSAFSGEIENNYSSTAIKKLILPLSFNNFDFELLSQANFLEAVEVNKDNPDYVSIDGIVYTKDRKKLVFYPSGSKQSVFIDENIEKISLSVFNKDYCPFIENVTISENNSRYKIINNCLCDLTKKVLLKTKGNCEGTFNIPEEVTSIYDSAFYSCKNITDIKGMEHITSIGKNAFAYCNSLKEIKLGDEIKEIPEKAFIGCAALENCYIPDCVTKIGNSAFSSCGAIENIKLPDNLTDLGVFAFNDCSKLKEINIPSRISEIKESTFMFCSELIRVNLSESLTKIGPSAFLNCSQLSDINLNCNIKEIGDHAFSECNELVKLTIPEGVEEIGDFSFSFCKKLREVILPESLKKIGEHAFCVCKLLQKINLPNNLTYLGDSAFSSCANLNNVVIPDSLKKINKETFSNCVNLNSFTFSNNIEEIDEGAFKNCPFENLSLPDSLKILGAGVFSINENLKSVFISKNLCKIGNECFSRCKSLNEFTVHKENCYYSDVDGVLYNKDKTACIMIPGNYKKTLQICKDVLNVDLEQYRGEDVVVDPENAIYSSYFGCLYNKEKTVLLRVPMYKTGVVRLPETVKEFAEDALKYCGKITDIEVDDGNKVFSSKDGILYDIKKEKIIYVPCVKQGVLKVPDSVTELPDKVFKYSCLSEVILSENLKKIGNRAFMECSKLESVYIPESVTEIGNEIFYSLFPSETEPFIKCKKGSFAEKYAIDNSIKVEYC